MLKKSVICVFIIVMAVFASCGSSSARNVILIVPDGASTSLWAAIRVMTKGVEGDLNLDTMPIQGRCRTYAANSIITDSAAAGTAFATGQKTNVGLIGVSDATDRGDSTTGVPLETIMEQARDAGFSTGLVTTSNIQHATPASFFSHRAERGWYNLIAHDMVNSGIDVFMGGGRQHMLPEGVEGEEGAKSKRDDDRNIIDEMTAKGYTYIYDSEDFNSLDPASTDKVLGLFNPGHMQYELERKDDIAGEPPLWEMASKAIDILDKNESGFLLVIEAARIDHAGHNHHTERWLWDGIACDKAVGVCLEYAKNDDNTMVFVIPDHGTGTPHFTGAEVMMLPGRDYSEFGFPAYELDDDGFPVESLGDKLRIEWSGWTGHTGEDVGYFAYGLEPGVVPGLIDNTDVYSIMHDYLFGSH